jgi:hypothetical protein
MRLTRLGSLKLFIVLDKSGDVPRGAVLIPRRNVSSPSVYPTIYDALRSRTIMLRRYGQRPADGNSELGDLENLREELGEVQVGLAEGAGARKTSKAFKGLTEKFGRVRDPFKVQAREKAAAGTVKKDGRINRGATRARATAVDVRLAKREQRIRDIAPWIGAMEQALSAEVDRCLYALDAADRVISVMLHGHAFFLGGKTSRNQLKGIEARLMILFDELSSFRTAPFCAFGDEITVRLSEAMGDVEEAMSAAACAKLTTVRRVIVRARVQKEIEDAIVALSLAAVAGSDAAGLHADLDRLWKRAVSAMTLDKTGVALDLFSAAEKLKAGDAAAAKEALKSASVKCVP